MNFLKKYFLQSVEIVRSNLLLFVFFSGLLLVGATFGFFLNSSDKFGVFESIQNLVENVSLNNDGIAKSNVDIALGIIANNVRVAAILIFTGALFGLFPILIVFSNGIVLGVVAFFINRIAAVATALGFDSGCVYYSSLLSVLPHGIFELPIILVSAVFGFRIGWRFMFPGGERRVKASFVAFIEALKALVFLIMPFLILAGVIESFATPQIALLSSNSCGLDNFVHSKILNSGVLNESGFHVVRESVLPLNRSNSYRLFFANESEFQKVVIGGKKNFVLSDNSSFNVTVLISPFAGNSSFILESSSLSESQRLKIEELQGFKLKS